MICEIRSRMTPTSVRSATAGPMSAPANPANSRRAGRDSVICEIALSSADAMVNMPIRWRLKRMGAYPTALTPRSRNIRS